MTLRYEAVTRPHKRWNLGGGVVDTGVPPSIVAQWILKGRAAERGVLPPEVAFDPIPFFKDLASQGRGTHVTEFAEQVRRLN